MIIPRSAMKYVLTSLFVAALNWATSDGVARARFGSCDSAEADCLPDLFPGVSCSVVQLHECPKQLNESLDGAALDNGAPALADISLKAYQFYRTFPQKNYPNLNLTFSNIKFTSVLVKVSVHMESNETLSVCKNITIHNLRQNISDPSILFYDCHWFWKQSQYMHHRMTLEYQTTNKIYAQHKKFHFRLPPNGLIDFQETYPQDFQLLIYREDDGQCVKFHWSRPPEKFQALYFKVSLHDVTDNLIESYNTSETYFCAKPKAGKMYNISVQPWLKVGDHYDYGSPSYSEKFYITSSLDAAVWLLVVLAVLLVTLLLLWCWCYIQLYSLKRKADFKKCLLVFEPSSERHLIVLKKFVLFLRGLQVPVKFAETDVARNENITDWYGNELVSSDLILFISNPCPSTEITADSIFHNAYRTGGVRECVRPLVLSENKSKRCIRIQLDYCSKDDFYGFTMPMPIYHISKDRVRLLQRILGPCKWLPSFISWPLYSPYFQSENWRNLMSAIDKYNGRSDPAPYTEPERDQTHQSLILSLSISDDKLDLNDLEDRTQKLETVKDEDSDAESESSCELHQYAEAQKLAKNMCAGSNTEDDQSISEMAMAFY